MSDIPALALASLVGALLGVFFFGGLWWTVQKGLASETPALWFLGSHVLRISVTLAGIYFVSQGHWSRLAACIFGFLVARALVVKWLTRKPRLGRARLLPSLESADALNPSGSAGVSPSRYEFSPERETSHAP